MNDAILVEAGSLVGELRDLGFLRVEGPRDAMVMLPHREWLDEFGRYLEAGNPRYASGRWDCDDFAMRAVTEASLALAGQEGLECGHAFLVCTVVIIEGCELNGVGGGAHATNLVKCADGAWYFFEPQNGKVTEWKAAVDAIGELSFAWV